MSSGQSSPLRLRFSERRDGDFHLDQDPVVLERRRRAFVDLPWSQPDEVHGTHVGLVRHPGDADGVRADALVTDSPLAVIGIWVGDCAPVALVAESGRIGGVHAGWRGLRDGIMANAVRAVRSEPGERVTAVIGPCIHACCYEFGAADLATIEHRFGVVVRASTSVGRDALDMPAAIVAALAELDVGLDDGLVAGRDAGAGGSEQCTGCNAERFFSHRVRGERERQIMAVWRA